MVSGWSWPWARSRSATVRSYSGAASLAFPAGEHASAGLPRAGVVLGGGVEGGDGPGAQGGTEVGLAQFFAGGQRVRMAGSAALLGLGDDALGEADRLLGAAGRAVGAGEAGPGRHRVGVAGPEDLPPPPHPLLLHRHVLARP